MPKRSRSRDSPQLLSVTRARLTSKPTFTCFPNLPLELAYQIWDHAIDIGISHHDRILGHVLFYHSEPQNGCGRRMLPIMESPKFGILYGKQPGIFMDDLCCLLHACRMARERALVCWRKIAEGLDLYPCFAQGDPREKRKQLALNVMGDLIEGLRARRLGHDVPSTSTAQIED